MVTRLQQVGQQMLVLLLTQRRTINSIWQTQLVTGDAVVVEGVRHFHL